MSQFWRGFAFIAGAAFVLIVINGMADISDRLQRLERAQSAATARQASCAVGINVMTPEGYATTICR